MKRKIVAFFGRAVVLFHILYHAKRYKETATLVKYYCCFEFSFLGLHGIGLHLEHL